LVQTGDIISLDVEARSLRMEVSDEELTARRSAYILPEPHYERGFGYMFSKHVSQAPQGCDFDFLQTDFGKPVSEPPIY
jgi:dihydroxy-acid dehydratase